MILYVNFWSDISEGTMLHKNKTSVLMQTITICPPQDQITSSKYTYVIDLERKEFDHDKINLIHNNKLQQLAQCTYDCYFGASHIY